MLSVMFEAKDKGREKNPAGVGLEASLSEMTVDESLAAALLVGYTLPEGGGSFLPVFELI